MVALGDPDERVVGRGFTRLRDAGVEVSTGIAATAAERDLAPYLHHRRTGRAFVVVKVALSLDGRVAAADGTSQWITSEAARTGGHELRADSQAIVVGSGTALADRPSLTVRGVQPVPARPPLRVLLDGRGRVPADGPLFDPALGPTLVITTECASEGAVDAWRNAEAKVEVVPTAYPGRGVDLDATFTVLGREGVLQALVEGGGSLIGSIVDGGHACRIVAFVAPVLLGTGGIPGFAFTGPDSIGDARRFDLVDVARAGHRCAPRARTAPGESLMFTGIVEELGRVRAVVANAGGARLEIAATTVLDDATLGASIAVNGCCLTVVELGDGYWAADAVVETLARTSLGTLAPGDHVNLERPVRLADRLGGHVVQGHVDATGTVRSREPQADGSELFRFDAPADVLRYVVHKGSITVDGISLTVAALHDEPNDRGFSVAVIPHTLAVTTLGVRAPGALVNLEVDLIAKYVERLLVPDRSPT